MPPSRFRITTLKPEDIEAKAAIFAQQQQNPNKMAPGASKRSADAAAQEKAAPDAKRQKVDEKAQEKALELLPVTVLSGFLGAGKTTLLKKILRNPTQVVDKATGQKRDQKIAVIVNDMGEVNLDADEIKNSKLVHEEAQMVELHNGCICCTLRGDLLKTVKELSEEQRFDYLVIESTGISEPLPVAQTFVMDVEEMEAMEAEEHDHDHEPTTASACPLPKKKGEEEEAEKKSLSNYATLDTLATVVDALNIFDVLGSIETLADENNVAQMKGNAADDAEEKKEGSVDDRSIAQLMLDQIEFANVIIVSKAQKMTGKDAAEKRQKLQEVEGLLKRLNPDAKVVVSSKDKFADIDTNALLLNTKLFDMEKAENSAGWLQELAREESGEGHTPETEEYGISSFCFREKTLPLHPERFAAILKGFGDYASAVQIGEAGAGKTKSEIAAKFEEAMDENADVPDVFRGVVRSKGSIWLANANSFPMEFHTAGKHLEFQAGDQPWLHAVPEEEWEEAEHEGKQMAVADNKWTAEFGDRGTELVFIGVHLDKKMILEKLQAAVLTEEESKALGGVDGWRTLEDPFFGGVCAKEYFDVPAREGDEEEEEEEGDDVEDEEA